MNVVYFSYFGVVLNFWVPEAAGEMNKVFFFINDISFDFEFKSFGFVDG